MKTHKMNTVRLIVGGLLLGSALTVHADSTGDTLLREIFDRGTRITSKVEFLGLSTNVNAACGNACPTPGPDVNVGRQNFGLSPDGRSIDNTLALFQGTSQMVGTGVIVSNTRSCGTCHRPDLRDGSGTVIDDIRLGLPHTFPLSAVVPTSDALFTGRVADDGNHPDGFNNLNDRGLVLIRPGRFNPNIALNDPFRQVILWRKVPRFVNTALTIGFTNDGRMREVQETVRGAIFSHTQDLDQRFDDLLKVPNPRFPAGPPDFEDRTRNIAAFIESTTIDPPALSALLTPQDTAANPQCSNAPSAPCKIADCYRLTGSSTCDLATVLAKDPFFTVQLTTAQQVYGREVFKRQCIGCHNTPNVFGNVDHVPGLPLSAAPRYGKAFDVGVSQRNKHGLDFRAFNCPSGDPACTTKQLTPVVLPLVKVDGTVVSHTVTIDPGAAAATGRYEDLFRFKVPQLRRINKLGPYFHDNSAATLEEVLDHFQSSWYRNSADGKKYPIDLDTEKRAAVLAFLRAL